MASVRQRRKGGGWVACFTDKDGKQRQWGAGTRDKNTAQRIAEELETPYLRQKVVRKCAQHEIIIDPDAGIQSTAGGVKSSEIRDDRLHRKLLASRGTRDGGASTKRPSTKGPIPIGTSRNAGGQPISEEPTFTGIPGDRFIRQHHCGKRTRGGGDRDLYLAALRLAKLETQGKAGLISPGLKHLWNDAWRQLGETVFARFSTATDLHVLRRVDDALENARNDLLSETKLTVAEKIYWWAACFFKKYGLAVTWHELTDSLEDLAVAKRSVGRVLTEWETVLKSHGVDWKIDGTTPRLCLNLTEFMEPEDLDRGRDIYVRIEPERAP